MNPGNALALGNLGAAQGVIVSDDGLIVDLRGLTPLEFAPEIVLNEKSAAQRFGLTWTISTRWEEMDPEN